MEKHLTVDQISTYIHCPAKYLYRFVYLDVADPLTSVQLYWKILRVAILKFHIRAMQDREMIWNQVVGSWRRLWLDEPEVQLLAVEQQTLYFTRGVRVLRSFFEKIDQDDSTVVLVDVPYSLSFPMGEDKYNVTGNIDVGRVVNDSTPSKREVQLVRLVRDKVLPPRLSKGRDLVLLLDRVGFAQTARSLTRSINVRTSAVQYCLGNEAERKIASPYQNWRRLTPAIASVYTAIRMEVYYPRFGPYCPGCAYAGVCDPTLAKWSAKRDPRRTRQKLRSELTGRTPSAAHGGTKSDPSAPP